MRSVFNTLKENQKQCVIIQDEIYVKKCCYIMEELCLEERLMILNPLQNCSRSYDILHVWWNHICFENVTHCKIEFAVSL